MKVLEIAFTLIEIMVVIIGLLAAVIAPNVLSSLEDSQQKNVRSDLSSIEVALKMVRLDSSAYPTTEQGLEALVEKLSSPPELKSWRADGYL